MQPQTNATFKDGCEKANDNMGDKSPHRPPRWPCRSSGCHDRYGTFWRCRFLGVKRGAQTRSLQVLPEALKERMTHLALGGLRPVLDLGHQLGLNRKIFWLSEYSHSDR